MFNLRPIYTEKDDASLMALVERGKPAALDELYRRHARRMLFYFQKMVGEEARAQDLLHDLFLKLAERPELYTPGRSFTTWLFSIAHNMCKNEYRWRSVRGERVGEPEELQWHGPAPAEEAAAREFSNALFGELDRLDEDARATFLLRHNEGLSIAEIAEALGCPAGTVKSRLFNTTRRLAEKLKEFNPHQIEKEPI